VKPQFRAVHAAHVHPRGPLGREVIEPAAPEQLPGDLEIQRQLGQARGLYYPVQPACVGAVLAWIDIFEGRLFAQRLQLHDRGIRAPQGIMRAGCDDQRQAELARTANREPDEVVTILMSTGSALGEGLL
jgi:hypothetical protein